MEVLTRIQRILLKDFPRLESNIISTSQVLHVFAPKVDLDGLNYLPNFHLIFHVHSDLETVIVKLVTFHGKTVDSALFKKKIGDEEQGFPEQIQAFVEDFSKSFKLCQGTVKAAANSFNYGDCLTEFLNDSIVVRSVQCQFKLKEATSDTKCEECAKIVIQDVKVEMGAENYNDHYDQHWQEEPKNDAETFEYLESPTKKLKSSHTARLKRSKSSTPTLPGEMKCEPIIETFDEESKELLEREQLKKIRHKRLGKSTGRPTDAESTREKFKSKCKICLRVYRSKPRYSEDQTKHAKYFDLEGSMECPLCRVMLKKQDVTGHFAQNHSDPEPTTCCIGCAQVMPSKDECLRKHIVKFHHNQVFRFLKLGKRLN